MGFFPCSPAKIRLAIISRVRIDMYALVVLWVVYGMIGKADNPRHQTANAFFGFLVIDGDVPVWVLLAILGVDDGLLLYLLSILVVDCPVVPNQQCGFLDCDFRYHLSYLLFVCSLYIYNFHPQNLVVFFVDLL